VLPNTGSGAATAGGPRALALLSLLLGAGLLGASGLIALRKSR